MLLSLVRRGIIDFYFAALSLLPFAHSGSHRSDLIDFPWSLFCPNLGFFQNFSQKGNLIAMHERISIPYIVSFFEVCQKNALAMCLFSFESGARFVIDDPRVDQSFRSTRALRFLGFGFFHVVFPEKIVDVSNIVCF